jgi:hypothetical protein
MGDGGVVVVGEALELDFLRFVTSYAYRDPDPLTYMNIPVITFNYLKKGKMDFFLYSDRRYYT